MSVMTANELVQFVQQAKAEGWGYVGGANGELYTPELAQKWADIRTSHSDYYYLVSCKRWFNRRVADCSGLVIAASRSKDAGYQDQTADTLYSRCTEKGTISTMPEIPGLCVWKSGHIGVYIGNGQVIEAAGYRWGVLETPVTAPKYYQYYLEKGVTKTSKLWTNWGKLRDIEYLEVEQEDETMLNKNSAPELIAEFQQELIDVGESLPKYGVDGKWGSETDAAIISFKTTHGLPADNIVNELVHLEIGREYRRIIDELEIKRGGDEEVLRGIRDMADGRLVEF